MSTTQRDANQNLGFFHDALAVRFLVARVASTVGGHQHITQPKLDTADIEVGDAGVAHSGENTAEVGIRGKKRGLDQWRVRDRVGDFQGLFGVARLFDTDGHELGRTFGIAHDLLREVAGGFGQSGFERGEVGVRLAVHHQARLAGGHEDEGIVGRGVAIDSDAVERHVRQLSGQTIDQMLGNASVRREITQHRGHVGPDHAGAFADAGDRDGLAADQQLA